MEQKSNFIKASTAEANVILLILLAILGTGVINFGLSPKIPVLFVITLLLLWAKCKKASYDFLTNAIVKGISSAIVPLVIFLLIGVLIAVWIQAGIIPTLMVIGFKLMTPSLFVPSTFLVCSLIGLSIGSGFTTISTVGIALFGIGVTIGQSPAILAGAILSGAIFGDKMSPLSDSTNLASAIAKVELFAHIKNMMWSTIPAFICSLIGFILLNKTTSNANLKQIATTLSILENNFSVDWLSLVPILALFVCAWKKIPAIFTLLVNILISCVIIFIHNPHFSITKLATLMEDGFTAKTSSAAVNSLLSRGGITSMADTITLILLTLALGGLLMELGIINQALNPIDRHLKRPTTVVGATLLACIGINIFVGEQYLSVILPGQSFKDTFSKNNLAPLALGRVLEDGGSVINYLIPWGVAGSFAASTLNVSVLSFLPFVFFSLLSPIFSLLSAMTGIGIKKIH